MPKLISRRAVLAGAAGSSALLPLLRSPLAAPPAITSERMRAALPSGVMSGDVTAGRATLWAQADRPARMVVEYATNERFAGARRIEGPTALDVTGFTARTELADLPPGADVFYRVTFQDLADVNLSSAPVTGRLRSPGGQRDVTFVFSGDEVGQGWGINPDFGGLKMYEVMRGHRPDFFIHSGDQIYADGPLEAEAKLPDGKIWKNLVTEAKSKVCTSLADYRGAFAYNLMDENKRRFAAEVPFLVQWDDHEVRNNWYPGQTIGDDRYAAQPHASVLAAYARRAMLEFNPIRIHPADPERIYRAFSHGPMLDVMMIDERTYRGPNSPNRQSAMGPDAAFLGTEQMRWLKRRLLASRATWKVIASDMPISIVVPDGNPDVPKGHFEAWANADPGAPGGRELEIANLLSFIKQNGIRNVVWVTADVHYAQAALFTPAKAAFSDFDPFWEFVAGPLHAGTFGPNEIDMTFGPDVKYVSEQKGAPQNQSPMEGRQYFGKARIDGTTGVMTVSLHDIADRELFKVDLEPQA